MRPYRIMFTVRRQFFDQILRGEKTYEFRRATKRWVTVLEHCNAFLANHVPVQAVFICGPRRHERAIVGTARFGRNRPARIELLDLGGGEILGFELGPQLEVG